MAFSKNLLPPTVLLALLVCSSLAVAQQAPSDLASAPVNSDPGGSSAVAPIDPAPAIAEPAAITPGTPDKRIFGVLPNYRTAESSQGVEPLTAKQKFTIAFKDSFDWPSYILAGGLAGLSQLVDSEPEFGQGMQGFAKRYAGGVADQIIGNMMSEAIFPVWLHEDPRYFRKNTGSIKSRLGYAASRVFVTRTDSGGTRFNFSEVVGNSAAVAISDLYYTDNRNWSDNVTKLATNVSIDLFSDILKEFWPDFKRKFLKRHSDSDLP